jgi:cyanophycin synthetase
MSMELADPSLRVRRAVDRLPPVQIVHTSTLHGSNVHHFDTVVRLEVDLGGCPGETSAYAEPGFADRFIKRFIELPTVVPDLGRSADFAARLRSAEGVAFAELLCEAILSLEATAATLSHSLHAVAFADVGQGREPERATVVWSTDSPMFSRTLAEVAVLGLNELLALRPVNGRLTAEPDFATALGGLRQRAEQRRMSIASMVIMQAARRRGIACARVGGPYLLLGQGRFQNLMISSTTERTSYAATHFAGDKRLTVQRLADLRLPVPRNIRVANVEEAIAAAERLGYPVVVKPTRGGQGEGITAGVKDEPALREAYRLARSQFPDVVVEQFLEGQDYRLLIVGDRFVAAVTRLPPSVTGDGKRTIDELVDELNADPYRDGFRLYKIDKDQELIRHLAQRGYDLDSILDVGQSLPLRTVANQSQGGYAIDVTDKVHRDNREMAVRAARAMRLDIAGIDFMTTDISRSYKDNGGGIIEVNARPGIDLHTWPRYGKPRDVGPIVIDHLYPKGAPWRVPVAAVVGDQRTAVIARDLDHFLRTAGRHVGLVIRRRAYFDGEAVPPEWGPRRAAARLMLRDPEIDTLVFTMSTRGVVDRGLQVRTTDVVAITAPLAQVSLDAYLGSIETLVRSNPRKFVFGASNRTAAAALSGIEAHRIVVVARGMSDSLRKHIAAGGSAFVLDWSTGRRQINVHAAEAPMVSIPFVPSYAEADDPLTTLRTGRRSQDAMIRIYAAALAYGLGLSPDEIAHAISQAPVVKN